MDEVYTRFQTKTVQKPGLFGAAHTVYGIYTSPSPPSPRALTMQYSGRQGFRNLFWAFQHDFGRSHETC